LLIDQKSVPTEPVRNKIKPKDYVRSHDPLDRPMPAIEQRGATVRAGYRI